MHHSSVCEIYQNNFQFNIIILFLINKTLLEAKSISKRAFSVNYFSWLITSVNKGLELIADHNSGGGFGFIFKNRNSKSKEITSTAYVLFTSFQYEK